MCSYISDELFSVGYMSSPSPPILFLKSFPNHVGTLQKHPSFSQLCLLPIPLPHPPQYQVPNLLTIVWHIKMNMKICKLGLELFYLNFFTLLILFTVSVSVYTYEQEVFIWNYKTKYFTDIVAKWENSISFQLVLTVAQC